jgi:hypothetical protein
MCLFTAITLKFDAMVNEPQINPVNAFNGNLVRFKTIELQCTRGYDLKVSVISCNKFPFGGSKSR